MPALQELEGLPRGPDGYVDWTRVKAHDIRLPADFDPDEGENEKEEEVRVDMNFDNVIFCDNLPVVPQEKYEKLVTVLTKIFGQIGQIQDGGFWMPIDDKTNMSKGFAFVAYKMPQEAAAAVDQINGYKLDKNHVFKVTPLGSFDKVANVPDDYVAPEDKDAVPREDDIHQWLMDERGRDQFAIRFADETEVYWNDAHQSKAEEVYKRNCWTESYVQWSSRGHYLATIHRQGAALWGGPGFPRLQRFAHPGVQFLDFSPFEKYLVTGSIREPTNARESTTITVRFFDIRSGRQVVIFQGGMEDFLLPSTAATGGARGNFSWPLFKWAGGCQDRFFAKIGKNAVHVYETPSMELLGKKPLRLEGVIDFQWSPAAPIFAVYQPEQGSGNQPARVSLWSVPEMQEIRQKNLFSVSEVRLFWHPQGEYLCVKVDRFTKTKKTTYTGFELFRVNEKECPMEVLELENKSEKIVAFAWEPNGHRFCVVHGDGPRPDVSFYTMRDGNNCKVKHVKTLKGKTVNGVYWSPQGRNLVLAGLKTMNGQLEFFNADEMETLATAEHFMCTDIDWDPTGRYVATSVTSSVPMENGFNMWSFNGKMQYRAPRDRFFQFLWRPRPPTLLSAEQEREIQANLKKYGKRYEELDESLTAQADTESVSRRAALMEEWKAWLEAKRLEAERPENKAALARITPPKPAAEAHVEEVEVDVEELINVTEEVLHFGTGKMQ